MLEPCSQEEADTRALLHLKHAVLNGHRKAFLRTADTDWVVNASFISTKLTELDQIWVGYGFGKTYRDIAAHEVAEGLGDQRCKALPMFHHSTGGDMSSALFNKGKEKAYAAWDIMRDELTHILIVISENPLSFTIDSDEMSVLERFIILQYDPKSKCQTLEEARREMFLKQLKPLEAIPPTKHAAYQHIRRSILPADEVYKALYKQPDYLPTGDFGWVWNDRLQVWMPHWTDLPDVSKGVAALNSCGCKKSCTGSCKCSRVPQRCTSLCACEGMCANNEAFDDE